MADLTAGYPRRALRLPPDLLLLWVYLGLLIFDFRRTADDGSSVVVVLGLANLGLGLVIVARIGTLSRRSVNWMLPMMAFALASTLTGVLRGQAVYAVLSHLAPLLIFIVAVLVVSNLRNEAASLLLPSIAFIALLSTAWKLVFGFSYTGLDIETIRYQIISGALPLLFAYGVTGILVERRKWTALAIGLSLLVIALSVTRTYLVVFAVSSFAAMLAIPISALGRTIRRGLILFMVGAVALFAIGLAYPEVIERWTTRMVTNESIGFDLTGATRLAEATDQLQKLDADLLGLLFGFGQAAETRFAGHAAQLVESVLGSDGVRYVGYGYGHVFYVGLIYVGGLVFALPVLGCFLLLLWRTIRRSRRTWKNMPMEARFATIWGVSAFAGYLFWGFFGATWGDRAISFYFGISMGIAIRGSRLNNGRY